MGIIQYLCLHMCIYIGNVYTVQALFSPKCQSDPLVYMYIGLIDLNIIMKISPRPPFTGSLYSIQSGSLMLAFRLVTGSSTLTHLTSLLSTRRAYPVPTLCGSLMTAVCCSQGGELICSPASFSMWWYSNGSD